MHGRTGAPTAIGHRRLAAMGLTALTLGAAAIAAAPEAQAARALYVSDGGATPVGTISQFAMGVPGGALSPLVPPTVETGAKPQHMTFTSDGRFAYGSAAETGMVYAYRVGDDGGLTPLSTPAVPAGVGAHGVVASPDGRSLYVAAQESGAVFQYDIGPDGVPTPKSPASVPSGEGASGVAVSPDGRSVYVTNLHGASLSQYDADPVTGVLTPKSPATVRMPPAPSGLAVSPDGRSLYVAALTGRLAQLTIRRDGTVRPKNPAIVRVGAGAAGVGISPDGRNLYTPNGLVNTMSQFLVDRRTGKLTALRPRAVRTAGRPGGIAVAPNGHAVYASSAAESAVTWFSVGPRGHLLRGGRAPISAGQEPHGVAITPDQGPTADLAGPRSVRHGQAVRLDASGSSDPDGTVRRYHWRFGDGHREVTTRPTVRHRYHRPGRYTVRLMVVDNEGCSDRLIYTGQMALCNGGDQAIARHRLTVRR